MRKLCIVVILLVIILTDAVAQKMYNTNPVVDIPVAALGFTGTTYGLYKRFNKPPSDSATILKLDNAHMNCLDLGATRHYNKGRISDALFILGVTSPWVLFNDRDIYKDRKDIWLMYIQTLGLSAAGYALTAGSIDKYRPYAYNPKVPMKRRMSTHAKNSFYCGHPSVMAAGIFFTAKVYTDYHPNTVQSRLLWTYAVASTIGCGTLRYFGGYHFPSDIAIGMATGAAIGVLVPMIHKNRRPDAPGPVPEKSGTFVTSEQIRLVFKF